MLESAVIIFFKHKIENKNTNTETRKLGQEYENEFQSKQCKCPLKMRYTQTYQNTKNVKK